MSIKALREIIDKSDNIVFFGGAGVSTESNIPDFRSANGLYNKDSGTRYSPEEILSRSFFTKHTKDFYDFYRSKMIYKEAEPNYAHLALAKLEKQGKLKAVITQNIDGLHQKAGSKNVLELHGSIHRNYCMNCHEFFVLDYIINSADIPKCSRCGGVVKPDVVLYEEGLNMNVLQRAVQYIEKAEVLIVGGTSLSVYPAANLVTYYKGSNLVLINKTGTPYDSRANLIIKDSIGEVFKNIT
ncbi:NAD-dependent protein deacylase [Clostridium swellfunianum]|uniref:NAD-dependent protein deacylase n=1 Tax=Clostridium swellfunianum TaxID=1367462 RepID=UPI00202F6A86|nr:NAD-dependent protein deacylase [Clostridium swellfunianum]MCM0648307.1 NAD-dependent protein deacylase [Clostridium swellfunianum]